MEIVVHSTKSPFQQKFQKKLYHFNRNSQFKSGDVNNDPIGHPQSDKKIRLPLPVLLGNRLRLHPETSDSLRLRNPGYRWWVQKRYVRSFRPRARRWWAGTRKQFTNVAAADSSPAQHSLRKQSRDPRSKQAGRAPVDHSWHSERSTESEYNETELRDWLIAIRAKSETQS